MNTLRPSIRDALARFLSNSPEKVGDIFRLKSTGLIVNDIGEWVLTDKAKSLTGICNKDFSKKSQINFNLLLSFPNSMIPNKNNISRTNILKEVLY